MKFKTPLFKIYADKEDEEAVLKVIRRKTYWAIGPEIEEFEDKIKKYIGTKFALVFNSGTSALHTLLLAHDVKNKEVIVPSFTFISTINSIILAGGIPVFAECEEETFGLNAEDAKRKISEKTKAIILVHYAGLPARDTILLKSIADEKGLLLIEDAAESMGASIDGIKCGCFGNSAILSFCQNKIITTGEGGALVTDSQEIYEKAKLIRSHGRLELSEDYFSNTEDNDYIEIGYNYRMPTICAALGISQLSKIDMIIRKRRELAYCLTKGLNECKRIRCPTEPNGHNHVYQMYTLLMESKNKRDSLQRYLSDNGVMSKVYFQPTHLKTYYKKRGSKEGDLLVTESVSDRVLTIPLYIELTQHELDNIVTLIRRFEKDGRD